MTADGITVTIHIPVQFKRRGGRKLALAPDGTAVPPGRHGQMGGQPLPPHRNSVSIAIPLAQAPNDGDRQRNYKRNCHEP